MTIDNLHQKHHGLPGVGFSSGTNGMDGEGGNNVYFGYINDFFETIKMDADNLIRIAQETSTGKPYTGMFTLKDGAAYSPIYDTSSGGHFVEIMEDPQYPGRYNYTFDASTDNMKMYVKADVNETGKPDAWNKSTLKSDGRWKDEV